MPGRVFEAAELTAADSAFVSMSLKGADPGAAGGSDTSRLAATAVMGGSGDPEDVPEQLCDGVVVTDGDCEGVADNDGDVLCESDTEGICEGVAEGPHTLIARKRNAPSASAGVIVTHGSEELRRSTTRGKALVTLGNCAGGNHTRGTPGTIDTAKAVCEVETLEFITKFGGIDTDTYEPAPPQEATDAGADATVRKVAGAPDSIEYR